MSIRVSSRSTKGQNKHLQAMMEQEPGSYYKSRRSGEQHDDGGLKAENGDGGNEDEGTVRCPVCGANDENYDAENDAYGDMVQCDGCNSWQHIRCMTNGEDNIDRLLNADGTYFCDQCNPSKYTHLLEHGDKEYQLDDGADHEKPYENPDDNIDDDDDDEDVVSGKRQRSRQHQRRSVSSSAGNVSTKRRKSSTVSDEAEGDTRLRHNAVKMFKDLFSKFIIPDTIEAKVYEQPSDVNDSEELADRMSKNLEKELYEACFDMESSRLNKFYPEKVRSLFSNLKDKKNLILKTHVINGHIPLSKLARMNAQELANPDLQAFKEKIESQSLDQLIIEQPDKPKWIKTHKGEELIEAQDEFQPEEDAFYSKHVISRHDESDANEVGTSKPKEIAFELPEQMEMTKESNKESQDGLIEVDLLYPDIDVEFSGLLKYLGASKELKNNPYMKAFGDAHLSVEGRLSRGKVLSYLHEMQATRAFLLYELIPRRQEDIENSSAANYQKLYEFLTSHEKIIGIKNKQRYEKNIYLIPSTIGDTCFAIESILEKNDSRGLLTHNIKKIFLLIVIKPELVF
ncbi:hypothetical protein HG536_0A04370 [Torulaspora globosa]|uniref:Transcription factor BYE1 n=1 Tax=Torulaspora globosa TaxID=48254 RepID=A0A7G3ZAT3_9SACH|nr:uncharacterized protein HG536_0A04370 [Torulaspora globosa]QLL30619.1 hypothetical protein HG536_0A04370 [Torulaspora globosa]